MPLALSKPFSLREHRNAVPDTFCDECLHLLTAPDSRSIIDHKRTFTHLEYSITKGCRLCSIFKQAWIQKLKVDPRGATTCDYKRQAELAPERSLDYIIQLARHSPAYSQDFMITVTIPNGPTILDSPPRGSMIDRLCFECSLGSQPRTEVYHVGISLALLHGSSEKIAGQPIREYPDIGLCRKWIQTCVDNHPGCAQTTAHTFPKRIIDVGSSDGSENPKLVIDLENHNGKYIALSHCWGDRELPVTTTANLEDRICGIDWATLPPTFRDAVHVVRLLGFRYLWIDSLCILQDDAEDWIEQCPKMVSIYSNAVVTIAAAAAKDAFGGLLHMRTANDWSELIYVNQSDGGDIATVAVTPCISESSKFPTRCVEWPPVLAERAWALQERLLSPRVLYFGSQQMYFECNSGFLCECLRYPLMTTMAGVSSRISRKNRLPTERHELLEFWSILVWQYSACKLTYRQDRLVAIAGLAKMFQEQLGDEYCAGIWKGDLTCGLSWCRVRPPGMSLYELPAYADITYRTEGRLSAMKPASPFPSWTWASCKYMVITDTYRGATPNTTLLDVSLGADGPDALGDLSKGIVSARGKVKPAFITGLMDTELSDRTLLHDRHNWVKVGSANLDDPFFGASLDASRSSSEMFTADIECLLLSTFLESQRGELLQVVLVLERVDGNPLSSTYRRIGLGDVKLGLNWFDDAPESEITII